METYKEFSKAVESFFEDYLIKERGVSPQTIRAYGQTMKLYLEYCSKMGVPPEKISLQKLVRTDVAHFLDWLESEKCCSVSSRNQRLAAMRAFAKYLIMYDPIHIDQWTQICTVRVKKHTQETVNYLSVEGMACILRQIQKDTPRGRRDLTMLSLLYNSGARVQELIDLTPANLQTDKPYTLIVEGKRRKKRPIPLDEPIAKLVINYIRENYLDRPGKERHPLFYNAWGGNYPHLALPILSKSMQTWLGRSAQNLFLKKSVHMFSGTPDPCIFYRQGCLLST